MTKISIIMPVYNKENYLSQSIDSVLAQSFNDFELLCINDGSTDNSLKILKQYQQRDSRIKVFDKVNTGVSDTRNFGLSKAQGEYIMFLDADDLFIPDACQIAFSEIDHTKADIGIFISNITKHLFVDIIAQNDCDPDWSAFQLICWDKIYRKTFLEKHKLSFKKGLITAEDTVFCFLCMAHNPRYCLINKELHEYIKSDNGASRNINALKSDLESFKYLFSCDIIKKQSKDFKIKIINMKCRNLIFWYQHKFPKQRKIIFKDIVKFINLFREIVDIETLLKTEYFIPLWRILLKKQPFYFMYFSDDMCHKIIKFSIIKIKFKCKKI